VLPLVIGPAEHQRILAPDQTTGEFESGLLKSAAKVESFRVGVANINRGAVPQHAIHDYVRAKQKLPEGSVLEVVVLNLPRGAFVIHVVRRIGKDSVGSCAGEQFSITNGSVESPQITRVSNMAKALLRA
jgi:hypothetical protein